MVKRAMLSVHKVNLSNISGDGEFPCPKCGSAISPDDETEDTYTIVDTVVDYNDSLESLVIKCKKCKIKINLEGFDSLTEEDNKTLISDNLPQSKPGYRTYHSIAFSGNDIGQLTVEYAQKEDVKVFKRVRKLRKGKPFKAIIAIEYQKKDSSKEEFEQISKAVKKKFKGLRNGDVYITTIQDGKKNFQGRY